ncbi:hypothetical protein LCGC14_3029940, partial [marine sediment metagenome]
MNKQEVIEIFESVLGEAWRDGDFHEGPSKYYPLEQAEALYARITREFPEEAIRRALVKIKGPPTGDGNHWYTVGYDDAFNDLKNLWVGVDYSKIKFEPLIPKPCLHDRGLLRVEGTKPHCVTHGCETEVDERKGQRRVKIQRYYDDILQGHGPEAPSYGRRLGKDRRHE